jgi:hypothetical protein
MRVINKSNQIKSNQILKEPRLVELVMVVGRELRSVGPRKEKDLSPYDARRARGTRREVVQEDLKDRAGV